ncbi:hypothetical protein VB716_14025 [Synechococcus sp. CCY9201]|uniref:hypothetical protein n=1 Tax=unclassified Synechococcus TaxID=2626047 RepID=UPI002B1F2256|nr:MULTISPECIES: hypothetical protein [unclassified Synechococcus]MEA5422319.1 hypothetical protein [Synechococcus sp. CCY9202]MEA5475336.1 hypothetical protein [Synechococcus sp. CCY9201]
MSRAHHRPPPRWWDSLLIGLTSMVIGTVLARFILAMAEQARQSGNLEQAFDSTVMLFSPAIFLLAGAGLISRGLLGLSSALLQRRPRHRSQSEPPPSSGPPTSSLHAEADPQRAQPGHDRYRRACAELGVLPGSSWPVIRATWRRKLQEWHPDQGGDPELWYRRLAAYTLLEAWERFEEDSPDQIPKV